MRLADDRDVRDVGDDCASTCSTSPGIHVEARHDDDVLGAVDEREPAVGVGDPDVAGVQPAVGEHARGRVGIVASSRRTRSARARGSRPGSPSSTSLPSVSTSRTSTPGSGGPIEPGRGVGDDRGRRDDRRRLGEPVAVVHVDAEALRASRSTSRRGSGAAPETHSRTRRERVVGRGARRRARATLRRSRAPPAITVTPSARTRASVSVGWK